MLYVTEKWFFECVGMSLVVIYAICLQTQLLDDFFMVMTTVSFTISIIIPNAFLCVQLYVKEIKPSFYEIINQGKCIPFKQ